MPAVGECLYQGVLTIEDHRVWIGDLERINRHVKTFGLAGAQPITVYVDDPGAASRVYVGFGLTDAPVHKPLTSVEGHPLPTVLAAPGHSLVQVNELGLIFDDYDSPLARLAGALKLLSRPRPGSRTFPDRFDIEMLAQWLRRLAWNLSLDRARTLCELARDRISATEPVEAAFGLTDDQVFALASEITDRI